MKRASWFGEGKYREKTCTATCLRGQGLENAMSVGLQQDGATTWLTSGTSTDAYDRPVGLANLGGALYPAVDVIWLKK